MLLLDRSQLLMFLKSSLYLKYLCMLGEEFVVFSVFLGNQKSILTLFWSLTFLYFWKVIYKFTLLTEGSCFKIWAFYSSDQNLLACFLPSLGCNPSSKHHSMNAVMSRQSLGRQRSSATHWWKISVTQWLQYVAWSF